jgi:exodeoxyribonuclease X
MTSHSDITLIIDSLELIHGNLIPILQLRSQLQLFYTKQEELITSNSIIYNSRYAILDTETTGLYGGSSIVSLAVVLIEKGQVVDTFYSLINPGITIPPDSTLIHHITDEQVRYAPMLAEVMPVINALISDSVACVAHNAYFDRDRLRGLMVKPWIDTLILSRSLHKELASHKLEVLKEAYGLEIENPEELPAHHALYDTRVAGSLFLFLLRELLVRGKMPVNLSEIKGYAVPKVVRKCVFGKHRGKQWEDIPTDYLKWIDREYCGKWDMLESARWQLRLRGEY